MTHFRGSFKHPLGCRLPFHFPSLCVCTSQAGVFALCIDSQWKMSFCSSLWRNRALQFSMSLCRVSAGRLDQPGDPFLQGLEIQNTQTPAQWRALSWDGVSLFQLLLFTCFVCLQIIFLPPYYPLSAPVSNKCSKEPSPGSLGQQQKKMQPFQKMAPISSSVFFWSRQRTVQSPASSPFQK